MVKGKERGKRVGEVKLGEIEKEVRDGGVRGLVRVPAGGPHQSLWRGSVTTTDGAARLREHSDTSVLLSLLTKKYWGSVTVFLSLGLTH